VHRHVTHASLGPSEYTIQNGILIGSTIFAQLTAVSSGMPEYAFPLKLSLHMGSSGPLSTTWFLEPTRTHNPNGITICSAVFAQITAERPYALQRAALSPLKMAPSHRGSGPHLICGTLGPYEPTTQTASGSVQSFLQSSWMWQTDRWTDHDTRSVTTVVGPTAMRPKMGHMTLTTPLWGG